ncbi:MAG: ABC transporter ATP-binding protein [Streptococcaceae bacterium]|jgi:osmoprotectant transport system ATP-binding protein|nr:ABC transporter ATP-binding protein [Streptococcaceae bacterium]
MTIELKEVGKRYGTHDVLSDVSLMIESREFFVLVGASGGGKTTLLKMINRLIEPTTGEIAIDGEAIRSMDLRKLRLQIGYVLQQGALFPNLTVAENIGLVPGLKGWKKDRIRARAEELLPLVGLDAAKYIDRMPSELSGGEAQRIGILRAIAADPKIILMDEPFSALDPISRKQLQDLMKDLQRKIAITTVFVTHDMNEAMSLADHIAIVREGHLLQVGTPHEIRQHPADAYVADFFKDYQKDLTGFTVENFTKMGLPGEMPLSDALKHLPNVQKLGLSEQAASSEEVTHD